MQQYLSRNRKQGNAGLGMRDGVILAATFVFALILVFPHMGEAYYRKKVDIQPLSNVSGWKGIYDPGKLVSGIMAKKIRVSKLMIVSESQPDSLMTSDEEQDSHRNGPAQFVVSGTIHEFAPGKIKVKKTFEEQKKNLKQKEKFSARATVEYQVKDGFSGRVLWSQTRTGQSINGDMPMGFSPQSLDPAHSDFHRTAMGQVLDKLTTDFLETFFAYSNETYLDGQIVSMDTSNSTVMINLGMNSGVEVGDSFNIYKVIPKYQDPLHKKDLGHWYLKLGVIRIRDVQPGFAKAVIRAGENFNTGDVARSKIVNPIPSKIETMQVAQIHEEEPVVVDVKKKPIFSTHVPKNRPRRTAFKLDIMGDAILNLGY